MSAPGLSKIYEIIGELVKANDRSATAFASVLTDMVELRQDMQELRRFVEGSFADAITARNIWRSNALEYKRMVTELREQLDALQKELKAD